MEHVTSVRTLLRFGSLLLLAGSAWAFEPPQPTQKDGSSGGVMMPEQAAFDVQHYGLDLEVNAEERSIQGSLEMRAKVVHPMRQVVLHLDDALTVHSVEWLGNESQARVLPSVHQQGLIWAELGTTLQPGTALSVRVNYSGQPKAATNPPWTGGFTWSQTPSGEHWIATSCQQEGADLWWPCKDHPSDEPLSMDLRIAVPEPLVCASNGKLLQTESFEGKGKHAGRAMRRFHWRVSTPINNYCVALNIAPYVTSEATFDSVAGTSFPIIFWSLPESQSMAAAMLPEIADHLNFYEKFFGPYPFRRDKYGVAETPFLGMEHQTIIAYGNRFIKDEQKGYDWLHHHELAHEWWGNLVTAADWRDFWIHEGIGTYAQNLYTEELQGAEAYRSSMRGIRRNLNNIKPVAPMDSQTTRQVYFSSTGGSDNDIYYKGAWIMHSLRYLIGDEDFFLLLRRMAYPNPELEAQVDGSACRFVSTEEFVSLAEGISEQELDWFFDVYLRQPALPSLVSERDGEFLNLRWQAPNNLPFAMPVDVEVNGQIQRLTFRDGQASLKVGVDAAVQVDPNSWLLKSE